MATRMIRERSLLAAPSCRFLLNGATEPVFRLAVHPRERGPELAAPVLVG